VGGAFPTTASRFPDFIKSEALYLSERYDFLLELHALTYRALQSDI
jgi:hypothetical protein